MFTYLREALTARFILKGIPEPQNVGRVEIQTLTLFCVYIFNASAESPAAKFITMLVKNFLEGSGLIDTNIALTIEIPHVTDIINDPEWERNIQNHYNTTYENGYYTVFHNEREVIFINEEDLSLIENLFNQSMRKRMILIFRKKKNVLEQTKTILTQNSIPLLDLPIPKPKNEFAKSITYTSDYGKYLNRSYESPQVKFWHDLFICILANVIGSFFKF